MPIIAIKILRDPLYFGTFSNWPPGVSDVLYKNMDAALGKYRIVAIIIILSSYSFAS